MENDQCQCGSCNLFFLNLFSTVLSYLTTAVVFGVSLPS